MSEDKRLNEIIRVQKRPSSFVLIDKSFLEDTRLSYKAKGILAYLLSKPDNWKVIVSNLVNYSVDGKASVYAGLKELRECGYYEKVPIRNDKGHFIRWESTVYECPEPLTEFREMGKPDMVYPYVEKQEHNNNYNTNKLNISNNHVQSCQGKTDRQTEIQATLALIHQNIDYSGLKISHNDDIELIDEFVNIILDALMSQSRTVRINGEDKPRELVKSNLMKLTYLDIEHVLFQFKEHGQLIKKKPQYILSMLYNSSMELNAHYSNKVQANWTKGEL